MKTLNMSNSQDREEAIQLCKNLIEKHALVPVVGSGFSFETQTDNGGSVPSANNLSNEMLYYIEKYSGYSELELDDIRNSSLSAIANDFWNVFPRIPEKELKRFDAYIQNNFLNISFRKPFQEAFLDVHWPLIFSLNYDTLIEDYTKIYYPIIPFNRINKRFYEEKSRLFKLHGDSKQYLETGDKRYLILSKDQYVESMMNSENEDMLNELLTAFSSKSIIFFGCSLSEEIDLLYSSQLSVKERANSIDTNQQSIIYVSFEDDDAISALFPARKCDLLAQYGVTHIFRISSEEQSRTFFRELADFASYVSDYSVNGYLEKFSSIRYDQLKSYDTNSREYLFQENLIWKKFGDHVITLPGFFISRSKTKDIVDCISKEPLCFISGNFYSGKTFTLLEVARYFTSKKVYIFPSGTNILPKQLNELLNMKGALLFFDARSLTTAQIKNISNESALDKLSDNGSSFIIVIEATDAPLYKYIFEARNTFRIYNHFRISGCLDSYEEQAFNDLIGDISLPPYDKKDTLLDYIVRNEKELLPNSNQEAFFLEPQKELLAKNPKKRIKALIMLATEIRIPAKRAIQFGVDGAINEIIRCCVQSGGSAVGGSAVIEKDYSKYCGDSSGYEFVCNSKYWIIRALSTFAFSQANSISIISDAYLEIIHDNRRINSDDVKFYQISEPYYFFDHIQVLFNHRWFSNSSKLMNAIYDKLLPVLSNSFQFLHQKAKGKLVIAQVQVKNRHNVEAKKTLKEALLNIIRAIRLAEKFPDAKNIEETLLHMLYTKGRILIEYSCISSKYIPQAVETCYDLYDAQKKIREDAYDFVTGVGNDKRSFEQFKHILITDRSYRKFSDLNKQKAEDLLYRWTGKRIRL